MKAAWLLVLAAALKADAPVTELAVAPRAAALGGACVACRSKGEALWGNPAGLLGPGWALSADSLGWIEDVSVQSLQGAVGSAHVALGLGTQGYSIQDGQRDELGRPAGSFGFSDRTQVMAAAAGGGAVAAGVAVRLHSLQWSLDGGAGNAYSETVFDGGLQGRAPWDGWRWGLGLRGLGVSQVRQSNCYICTPQFRLTQPSYSAGAEWRSSSGALSALAQAGWDSAAQTLSWHLGGEQTGRLAQAAGWALRLGWRSDLGGLGAMAGFSAGLGLHWSLFGLDYALSALGDFGLSHRAALSLQGGP